MQNPLEKKLPHPVLFRLIQLATVSVFLGRAYQHLFWDAPYREILWDPFWSGYIVENIFGIPWDDFAQNQSVDATISKLVIGIGFFYLACAVVAIFIKCLGKWGRGLMLIGSFALFVLALAYTKEHFYHFGQFFEYSLQICSPVFLVWLLSRGPFHMLIGAMKLNIALTFICHGLYAIGYYPVPGLFLSMTIHVFGTDAAQTATFLKVAGVLDFAVALGIFLPARASKWILLYAVIWGGATAMARIVGNFYWQFPLESLHQWTSEAVYRFPHFLIPAALWWYYRNNGSVYEEKT